MDDKHDIDQSTRCWAALNQALFRLHFGHHRIAFDSVMECISSAQEADDEKCLEFAFLLIAKIISMDKTHKYSDEDILRFLYHLLTKATKLDLPRLSAIAHLQFESMVGLGLDNKSYEKFFDSSNSPDNLAVKHSMPEVLMMSYACKSAQYASIGATHLTVLRSQALLHLHLVEHIGEGLVYRVNENTCIAIRNIALHVWRNCGHYGLARDMITSLAANLFSSYQTRITGIWEQASAEIQFEQHYLRDEWAKAENYINQIRLYDTVEGLSKILVVKKIL
ncbi:anaphase-promoting complex subunit 5-like [Brevipalpus obovatus]|uniref:anaphase-promoting complex subunit 5-like n=1 Tax=Brevipalpus obovatus TaxID=246614 RepID=UPI003D9EF674